MGAGMKATQQLKNEHAGIRTMLNILEKVCEKLEKTGTMENGHVEGIIEFMQVFVDKCHHGKEEDVLFPAMINASDEAKAPAAAMCAEHETSRGYVGLMSRAYTAYVQGGISSSGDIVENARACIALLRGHMAKENDVILEVADRTFPDARQNELFADFERIEEERIGHGKHEEFHTLLEKLSSLYL